VQTNKQTNKHQSRANCFCLLEALFTATLLFGRRVITFFCFCICTHPHDHFIKPRRHAHTDFYLDGTLGTRASTRTCLNETRRLSRRCDPCHMCIDTDMFELNPPCIAQVRSCSAEVVWAQRIAMFECGSTPLARGRRGRRTQSRIGTTNSSQTRRSSLRLLSTPRLPASRRATPHSCALETNRGSSRTEGTSPPDQTLHLPCLSPSPRS
jgi:hypothetical protein